MKRGWQLSTSPSRNVWKLLSTTSFQMTSYWVVVFCWTTRASLFSVQSLSNMVTPWGNILLFSTELHRMEDSRSAPFFQGYIKGTVDGIMGALKWTAVVRGKGNDIPNAYKWFAKKQMMKQTAALLGTMRMQQVITQAPGELIHHDVCCMHTCFKRLCFTFHQSLSTAVSQP